MVTRAKTDTAHHTLSQKTNDLCCTVYINPVTVDMCTCVSLGDVGGETTILVPLLSGANGQRD